jgi:hypothetical protein
MNDHASDSSIHRAPPGRRARDIGLAMVMAVSLAAAVPAAPPPVHREMAPAPLRWETVQTRTVSSRPPQSWTLILERTVAGYAVSGGTRRELLMSRIRIRTRAGKAGRDLAILQHLDDARVALLAPGDPRTRDLGTVLEDSLRPWPNTCMLGFFDTPLPLDLNRNGRLELAIRRFAALSEPGGSGLLFLEADEAGAPRLVGTSEFVGTVRFDEGNIVNLRWTAGHERPVLEAEFGPLYRCRFLSQLGIRGESGCESCCSFPIVLAPDSSGIFQPVYERESHNTFAARMDRDLAMLSAGGANEPLHPVEQAVLGRALAFLYLTGRGDREPAAVVSALGPRADLLSVKLFLERVRGYFLGG